MAYQVNDKYSKKAKEDGYKARSAYKLLEIQKKHSVLKPGMRVLDLGCAPGSWTQVATKIIGDKGFLIGIDLTAVDLKFPNAELRQGDAFALTPESFNNEKFNVVMSDMAPNTSGIKSLDQARSLDLCEKAFSLAQDLLLPGGHLVMKLFMGPEQNEFVSRVKKTFSNIKQVRPDSTRKTSTEVFLVALGFKK